MRSHSEDRFALIIAENRHRIVTRGHGPSLARRLGMIASFLILVGPRTRRWTFARPLTIAVAPLVALSCKTPTAPSPVPSAAVSASAPTTASSKPTMPDAGRRNQATGLHVCVDRYVPASTRAKARTTAKAVGRAHPRLPTRLNSPSSLPRWVHPSSTPRPRRG